MPETTTQSIHTVSSSAPLNRGLVRVTLARAATKTVMHTSRMKGASGKWPPPSGVAARYMLL